MLLHIHNGDATADVAKESSIPGEHFAWREALIEGPSPANVTPAEWRRRREQHLVEAYKVSLDECEQEFLQQEEKLGSFAKYDEVVLWFEHDLFCQVNLIYLLNWFAQQKLVNTKLSLVCIGSFPGKENFRGLGELNAEELSSLFPARQRVTQEQLDLSVRAWEAYRSPDPRDVQTITRAGTTALPFLGAALKAHLRRFPSTRNGLGLIENRGLEFIDRGATRFVDLFARFCDAEPIYGLGDSQFWLSLQRLTTANQPLLTLNSGKDDGENIARDAIFEMTNLGKAILKGEGDFVSLNGIDHWLGGVYLSDERNLWRWDEPSETIVLTRTD
jgi:hypothetical protein